MEGGLACPPEQYLREGSHYLYAVPTAQASGQSPRFCATSRIALRSPVESSQTAPSIASIVADIVVGDTTWSSDGALLMISANPISRPTRSRLLFETTLEIVFCIYPVTYSLCRLSISGIGIPRVWFARYKSSITRNRKMASPFMANRLFPSDVGARGDPAAWRLSRACCWLLNWYSVNSSRRAIFEAMFCMRAMLWEKRRLLKAWKQGVIKEIKLGQLTVVRTIER